MTSENKRALDICINCERSCCVFLPKPRYTKISTKCQFFSDNKCSKFISSDFRERLKAGRPLVCELFPAVVDLPVSEGSFIKVDILMHEFCKHASEILSLPSEREKIKEIIHYVFEKAAKNEHVDMLWGQFMIIRKEILKNPNYKLKINFTMKQVS
ncbi:MAG: hypothetical protein ACXQS8_02520 [Candidatus Helarchaeales archaeon]